MRSDRGEEIQLIRIGEIAHKVLKQNPCNTFFQDFQSRLDGKLGKRAALEFYEVKLTSLSENDWVILRSKVISQFIHPNSKRAWQSPFNILNEAIAYSYFLKDGCEGVAFIPEGNSKTPDISILKKGQKIACEVKTINVSDEKVRTDKINQLRWTRGRPSLVCSISDQLSPKFFETKVRKTIDQNLEKFRNYPDALRVFFFVMNFDDRFHEYADRYFVQIEQWLDGRSIPVDGVICLDKSTLWREEPLVLEWPKGLWKRLEA